MRISLGIKFILAVFVYTPEVNFEKFILPKLAVPGSRFKVQGSRFKGYNRWMLLPVLINIWNTLIPHRGRRIYNQMKTRSI